MGDARVRVLQSTPPPGPRTNPYVIQLHSALRAAGADVLPFSWRTALLGRYDLVHTHWPEILVWGRDPVRALARQLLTAAWVLRLALTRTPVVRTVHNLAPHEPVRGLRSLVVSMLEARERAWVRLSAATPTPDPSRTSTVPLGHFVDWFAACPTVSARPHHVVVPGVVRAYKGLDELVAALALLPDEDLVVHVVGPSTDTALAERLERAAADDPRLQLTLTHVPDPDLVAAVTGAQLVVLPYRALHNSAAAVMALSLSRPVLVPSGPTTTELASEVGEGWVLTGDMSTPTTLALALQDALDRTSVPPPRPPDLSARDWAQAGVAHLAAYRAALAGRAPRDRDGCA